MSALFLFRLDGELGGVFQLCAQDLRDVILCIYLFDDIVDDSFFVDHESNPRRAHVSSSVHGFFNPCTVRCMDSLLSIGKQSEGQFFFFYESFVAAFVVRAYAENLVTLSDHRLIVVAQVTSLCSTTGCHVSGIEIQHYFLSTQVRQFYRIAIVIINGEIGCLVANLELHAI